MAELQASTTENDGSSSPAREERQRRSLEVFGEIVLLVIVGGVFTYLLIESFEWPLGSALMPRITVALGAPFWLWRVMILWFKKKENSSQIMDIGFRIGADPRGERARFIRICSFIVVLYLAIWLLGMYIALPAGVFFYLFVYGRAGWLWSTVVALFFVVLLVGVYDHFLAASWHDPPLLVWLGLWPWS